MKPWISINTMSNAVIGRYESEAKAWRDPIVIALGSVAEIQYRPRAKNAVKKFPYNGK